MWLKPKNEDQRQFFGKMGLVIWETFLRKGDEVKRKGDEAKKIKSPERLFYYFFLVLCGL